MKRYGPNHTFQSPMQPELSAAAFRPVLVARETGIDILVYANQYELMYSLARFQEFYENPELKGKYFTRAELQHFSPDYYVKWNGCNIPPHFIEAFRALHGTTKMKDLDVHEQYANAVIRDGSYVIGVHLKSPDLPGILAHERAHALFYLYDGYRNIAMASKVPREVKDKLQSMGYASSVFVDEYQAYLISGGEKLGLPGGLTGPQLRLRSALLERYGVQLRGIYGTEVGTR